MLFSVSYMSHRINHERLTLNRRAKYGLSVKDEAKFRKHDLASRWLKQAEAEHKKSREQSTPPAKLEQAAKQRQHGSGSGTMSQAIPIDWTQQWCSQAYWDARALR